jgi:hypothetical protein
MTYQQSLSRKNHRLALAADSLRRAALADRLARIEFEEEVMAPKLEQVKAAALAGKSCEAQVLAAEWSVLSQQHEERWPGQWGR